MAYELAFEILKFADFFQLDLDLVKQAKDEFVAVVLSARGKNRVDLAKRAEEILRRVYLLGGLVTFVVVKNERQDFLSIGQRFVLGQFEEEIR